MTGRLRLICTAVTAVVLSAVLLAAQTTSPGAGRPQAPPPFPETTVDGRTVNWSELREKTVLITFFSTRMKGVVECLRCYQAVYEQRRLCNLELIAVCIDDGRLYGLRAFLDEHGFTFPVLVDSRRAMTSVYQPKAIPHAFFFAEGPQYVGDLPGYPDSGSPSPAAFYTNLLRRGVGLEADLENDPATTPWPELPDFAIPDTDISRKSLLGAPFVLTFVAADCDVCKAQLEFFRSLHAEFVESDLRFVVVLVTDDADPDRFREQRRLPFEVYSDRGGALRHGLRYRGFVPDTMVVDAEGRIRYRHKTFDDEQPALYRMELRRVLGLHNPPILKANGPSGVRRCMVCHEREYFDWLGTGHADAMRSLKAIGAAEKPECIQCHVVGWDDPSGFREDKGARAHLLEDVQCESCHTNGGPHLGDAKELPEITATTCTSCHDEKHSLGFEFDEFVGLVDHSSDLFDASPEQREAARRRREARRRELLEPEGTYVGSASCRECHQDQFVRWQDTPHAKAFDRLVGGQRNDPSCVRCHSTGLERSWAGRPTPGAGDPLTTGVQCEACHGPGERHVGAKTDRDFRQTIIGLGEKCEECVIRQICTTCHDRDNDPEFDFAKALPPMQKLCRPESGR